MALAAQPVLILSLHDVSLIVTQEPTSDALLDDDLDLTPPKGLSKGVKFLLGALVVVLVFLGMGMVGQLSGAGFFGHRTWMYGEGTLYVLNFQAPELQISIDGRPAKEVPFENAQVFDLVGGSSDVVVTDKQGKQVGRYTIEAKNSHALLKLGPETCVVALDLGPYYGAGGASGDGKLLVKTRVMEDQQIYVPKSTNIVWPNKDFPSRFNPKDGDSLWIEKVACALLKPEEEHLLLAYMQGRLRERMSRFKEANKPAR